MMNNEMRSLNNHVFLLIFTLLQNGLRIERVIVLLILVPIANIEIAYLAVASNSSPPLPY